MPVNIFFNCNHISNFFYRYSIACQMSTGNPPKSIQLHNANLYCIVEQSLKGTSIKVSQPRQVLSCDGQMHTMSCKITYDIRARVPMFWKHPKILLYHLCLSLLFVHSLLSAHLRQNKLCTNMRITCTLLFFMLCKTFFNDLLAS